MTTSEAQNETGTCYFILSFHLFSIPEMHRGGYRTCQV